jgi:WD40 repeat protein
MKVTQVYEGHFDEITKLAVVGTNIISASLDGTIRIWDTREAPKKLEIAKVEEPKESSGLTEEEERELAELMGDDDD